MLSVIFFTIIHGVREVYGSINELEIAKAKEWIHGSSLLLYVFGIFRVFCNKQFKQITLVRAGLEIGSQQRLQEGMDISKVN